MTISEAKQEVLEQWKRWYRRSRFKGQLDNQWYRVGFADYQDWRVRIRVSRQPQCRARRDEP